MDGLWKGWGMVVIIEQAIIAVTAVRLSKDQLRTIYVKEGAPMEVAYLDDDNFVWVAIDDFLDKDDYVPAPNCLLGINEGRLLFLATAKGRIYRSTNGARNWNVIEDGVYFNTSYVLLTETLGRIIAVNQSGTIYSDNDGDSWTLMPKQEWKEVNSGLIVYER